MLLYNNVGFFGLRFDFRGRLPNTSPCVSLASLRKPGFIGAFFCTDKLRVAKITHDITFSLCAQSNPLVAQEECGCCGFDTIARLKRTYSAEVTGVGRPRNRNLPFHRTSSFVIIPYIQFFCNIFYDIYREKIDIILMIFFVHIAQRALFSLFWKIVILKNNTYMEFLIYRIFIII